jgi:hypothetical protein
MFLIDNNILFHRIVLNKLHLISRSAVLFSLIIILYGCKSIDLSNFDKYHKQIDELLNVIVELKNESPNLPAFESIDKIINNAFSQRSMEDINLLQNRMYYEILQKSDAEYSINKYNKENMLKGDALKSRIHDLLSKPISIDKFSREYFNKLIDDTKKNISSDSNYDETLNKISKQLANTWNPTWDTFKCNIDGVSSPISACRHLYVYGLYETFQVIYWRR